ncbi:MAG TPA: hypothetical protein VMK65_06520 [Longimicrobiales bacterium]|nr:hypothetical protein [Longimicrobiales bacterium]
MRAAHTLALLAGLLVASCAPADEAEPTEQPADPVAESEAEAQAEGEWPTGWEARLDRPDRGSRDDVQFVTMAPGWHVTTGPATILYDATRTASAPYRVEAEMHLFDPGQRREGFGIFIGGRDLEGEGQAYTYFLLRQDGRFLIKRRAGEETPTVVDWTEEPAIAAWAEREEGETSVANTLAVDVGTDEVVFSVNGTEVARVPASSVDRDGVAGLRVNHALDLHVARFDIQGNGGGGQ